MDRSSNAFHRRTKSRCSECIIVITKTAKTYSCTYRRSSRQSGCASRRSLTIGSQNAPRFLSIFLPQNSAQENLQIVHLHIRREAHILRVKSPSRRGCNPSAQLPLRNEISYCRETSQYHHSYSSPHCHGSSLSPPPSSPTISIKTICKAFLYIVGYAYSSRYSFVLMMSISANACDRMRHDGGHVACRQTV